MTLDKYSQLKIAGNILGFTIKDFAKEHGTYTQVIRDVCMGHTTSARLSKVIDDTIDKAEDKFDEYRENKKVTSNQ